MKRPGEEKTGEEKTGEEKTREEKTREEKTREEKTREEKTGEEKTGEEKTGEACRRCNAVCAKTEPAALRPRGNGALLLRRRALIRQAWRHSPHAGSKHFHAGSQPVLAVYGLFLRLFCSFIGLKKRKNMQHYAPSTGLPYKKWMFFPHEQNTPQLIHISLAAKSGGTTTSEQFFRKMPRRCSAKKIKAARLKCAHRKDRWRKVRKKMLQDKGKLCSFPSKSNICVTKAVKKKKVIALKVQFAYNFQHTLQNPPLFTGKYVKNGGGQWLPKSFFFGTQWGPGCVAGGQLCLRAAGPPPLPCKGYITRTGVILLAKYVGKRLLYAAMTVFLLIALTFFMMQLLPGDPFIGEKAIPEVTMNALKAKYGLDKPLLQQFVTYVGNVLKGDLGISIHYNRAVTKIISETFPYSFELGVRALIFAICAGVGLGILAAVRRGTGWDTFGMTLAVVGISIPSFVVASFLQYFFSLKLRQWFGIHLFPVTGWTTVWHKILPSFALSFGTMATLSRLMRTSMLDVMSQDYIKTAKAKGLSQRKIIWRHAVRNAIMPVITVLGPITAGVLTGAFVIESVFSIPGMGRFFVLSIQVLDYTMIAGTTLFYGVFLVIATLVVDIAYGFIDPRVKLAK